jgi:hypothetical protein
MVAEYGFDRAISQSFDRTKEQQDGHLQQSFHYKYGPVANVPYGFVPQDSGELPSHLDIFVLLPITISAMVKAVPGGYQCWKY